MITVVSGLPRSGTSLMMQMLAAGGLTPLTDQVRKPDADNPAGYYEWETIKQLPSNPALIAEAENRVVKVVSPLLTHLPQNRKYRIVFIRRPLAQVVASQAAMIARLGRNAGGAASAAVLQAALDTHLRSVVAWLGQRPGMPVHWVDYVDLVAQPLAHASDIAEFLADGLDVPKMAAQVDPTLFRNR